MQQSIRDTIRNRKEQLLRAAYLVMRATSAKVTNYLAEQVMESLGKLPELNIPPPVPGASGTPGIPPAISQPQSAPAPRSANRSRKATTRIPHLASYDCIATTH